MKEQMTDTEIIQSIKDWFSRQSPITWIYFLLVVNTIIVFVIGVVSLFIGTDFIKNEGAFIAMAFFSGIGLFITLMANLDL